MHQFTLVGLQRTGTNFVELIAAERTLVTFNTAFHKHSTVDGTCFDGSAIKVYLNQHTEILIILVVRHPVLWIESLLTRSFHDFESYHGITVSNTEAGITQLVRFYCRFYEDWIEAVEPGRLHIVQYEEALQDNGAELLHWISSKLGSTNTRRKRFTVPKLKNSVEFSRGDYDKNIHYQSYLDQACIDLVSTNITKGFNTRTGYGAKPADATKKDQQVHAREFLYHFSRDIEVARSAPREMLRNLERLFPDSVAAALASHVARSGAPDYEGRALTNITLNSEKSLRRNISGDELFFVISVLTELGHLQEAEYVLERHDEYSLRVAQSICLRARIFERSGKQEDAITLLKAGYAIDPRNLEICCRLAELFNHVGRSEEALEILSQALTHHPFEYWLLGTRSRVYVELGMLAEAKADAEKAVDLLRTAGLEGSAVLGGYLISLAIVLAKLGRKTAVSRLVHQIRDTYPRTDWYDQQMRWLKTLIQDPSD
jgi:tetratricopeptide (TPR) repeat protein